MAYFVQQDRKHLHLCNRDKVFKCLRLWEAFLIQTHYREKSEWEPSQLGIFYK